MLISQETVRRKSEHILNVYIEIISINNRGGVTIIIQKEEEEEEGRKKEREQGRRKIITFNKNLPANVGQVSIDSAKNEK